MNRDELGDRLRGFYSRARQTDEDDQMIARLREAVVFSHRPRSRRRWVRPIVIPVALLLSAGAGAVALAASGAVTSPVRIRYVPPDRSYQPSGTPTGPGITCPLPQPVSIDELRKKIQFPLITFAPGSADLEHAIYQGSCTSDPWKSGYAILDYTYRGKHVQLSEGPDNHPNDPLNVNLKAGGPPGTAVTGKSGGAEGGARAEWRVIQVDGSPYAVMVLNGSNPGIAAVEWKNGRTQVNLSIGRKGDQPADSVISQQEFQTLLTQLEVSEG